MVSPKISIAIATYNHANYIAEAIESALAQTRPAMEILVVDDGSTDNTAEVVASFKSDKLRYIKKEHGGLAHTRNRGINESNGEFILWLDSDDILMPTVVDFYSDLLSDYPDADVLYGDFCFIDEEGNETSVKRYREYYRENPVLLSCLLSGNRLPQPGTMVRKSIYHEYGPDNLDYKRAPDYELWARIAHDAIFKHAGIIVCKYRVHGGCMSRAENKTNYEPEITIAKSIIQRFSLEQLFPSLDWSNEQISRAEAYSILVKLFVKWKDQQTALEYLNKCVDLKLGRNDYREILASAFISAGNSYLEREEYFEALKYFTRSVETLKTDRGYYKLALVANRTGDYDAAKCYYKKVLEINPDHKAAKKELQDIVKSTCRSIECKPV